MSLIAKAFADIVNFSRPYPGTRINAVGQVETVAENQPRFEYDPETLNLRGLLFSPIDGDLASIQPGAWSASNHTWVIDGEFNGASLISNLCPAVTGSGAICITIQSNSILTIYAGGEFKYSGPSGNYENLISSGWGIIRRVKYYPRKLSAQECIALAQGSVNVFSIPPLPLNSIVVSEGDSITAGSNGPCWIYAASILTNGKYYWPYQSNQAVGGQTAAQMATQTAAVVALGPKVVTLLAGTNDLAGSSDTPETISANIQTCVNDYIAGGAEYVVLCKVLPRNDATWMGKTAARRADRLLLNDLIAAKASAKVKVVDIESTFDPSIDTDDGLHPNWSGAIKLGEAFANVLNTLIVSGDQTGLYLDSSNMLLAAGNPQLIGTAGAKSGALVTGNVATGWTVETNDSTIAVDCSKVANFKGAEAQNISISGTNSTNGRAVNFKKSTTYSGAAGEKYEAWILFELKPGNQNLRSLSVSCDTGVSLNSSSVVLMPTARGLSGVLRTIVQTPLTGIDTSNNVQCLATFAAGAVAANITWGKPFLRKIA